MGIEPYVALTILLGATGMLTGALAIMFSIKSLRVLDHAIERRERELESLGG